MSSTSPLRTRLRGALPWAAALSACAATVVWAALPLHPGKNPPTLGALSAPAGSNLAPASTPSIQPLDTDSFARLIVRPRESRAAQAAPVPEPAPPAPLPPPLELLGFINAGHADTSDQRKAILYMQDQDSLIFVAVGERVGDAQLLEIGAASVRVAHGGHQHVLTLQRSTP